MLHGWFTLEELDWCYISSLLSSRLGCLVSLKVDMVSFLGRLLGLLIMLVPVFISIPSSLTGIG